MRIESENTTTQNKWREKIINDQSWMKHKKQWSSWLLFLSFFLEKLFWQTSLTACIFYFLYFLSFLFWEKERIIFPLRLWVLSMVCHFISSWRKEKSSVYTLEKGSYLHLYYWKRFNIVICYIINLYMPLTSIAWWLLWCDGC